MHQYSEGSLLWGDRVTGEIQWGDGRLKLKSNNRGLCVICKLGASCPTRRTGGCVDISGVCRVCVIFNA